MERSIRMWGPACEEAEPLSTEDRRRAMEVLGGSAAETRAWGESRDQRALDQQSICSCVLIVIFPAAGVINFGHFLESHRVAKFSNLIKFLTLIDSSLKWLTFK